MNKTYKQSKIKNPRVAIIGCTHGDELIGKEVIDNLKNINLKCGSLDFIIANPQALKKNQRYIDQDLNRSFPGKENGNIEEKIAYSLSKKLNNFDIVIDIHSTNSNLGSLVVVTNLYSNTKNLIKQIPVQNVLLIKKGVFDGESLIGCCNTAASLEYGPRTSNVYKIAIEDIKNILSNLGMIEGKKNKLVSKNLYTAFDSFKIQDGFKNSDNLKEYKFIKKGQIVGSIGGKNITTNKDFYPMFIGEGSYKSTLAIMTTKEKVDC